ncbi:MAG: efflux transporter periplasmic adaptor subunit [Herbaspirillum sp.]|jgi:macrolide-specific efflux system membrane fusion protein|nr:efflux transporter periplasmic adaptor subunit [Herbaspirillum sp.]
MTQMQHTAAERAVARRYRYLAIGTGLLLILTLALAALLLRSQFFKPPPPPVKTPAPETSAVLRGAIEKTVLARGKLDLQKYVDVSAGVSGQVSDVEIAIGDSVKAGRQLMTITPAEQPGRAENNRAQLARLKADLAGQQAQSEFANLQFQRQTQLKEANATREDSYESSRMAMFSASAKVDAINAQIQQTEAQMREDEAMRSRTRVTAPVSGTVVALSAREGQIVNANRDVLLRIADLSRMTVQALVSEEDVTRLDPGMVAYFTTPGFPGKRWSGKLRQIMPLPADGSGQQGKRTYYTVLFDVANSGRELMSGMSADIWFVLEHSSDALQIPAAALPVNAQADGTYRVGVMAADGKITMRQVKVGIRTTDAAQVLSGLNEGDRVVLGAIPSALLNTAAAPVSGLQTATPKTAVLAPEQAQQKRAAK